MPVFEFDEPISSFRSNQTSETLSFSDGGINFTWSISSPVTDGNNAFGAYTGFLPSESGVLTASAAIGADDVWNLNVAGPGTLTKISGTTLNPITVKFVDGAGVWNVTFHGVTNSVHTITALTGSDFSITNVTGVYSHITFTPSANHNQLVLTSLTGTITCFCADTRIATTDGHVPVQELRPGDRLRTADGGTTTVRWLGIQEIDTRAMHPALVNPICISAGAIATGVPARDLRVSPNHAVEIDGTLYNAAALVNGTTIYQLRDMPRDGFRYYHIETDAHELLLAEGCAAESYLDQPDRAGFINGAERADAPPIREMALPRVTSARLLPGDLRRRLRQDGQTRAA